MARHRVKLTVLKRVPPEYIFDGNPPVQPDGTPYTKCTKFTEGQEIMVEKDIQIPEGFCTYAWNTVFNDVRVLALGGDNEPWVTKPKMYTCCTDGLRPVSFVAERIED